MPLAEKAGVPMFAPLVGTSSFRQKTNRYLFHVRAGYDLELRKIISHLSTIGIQSIAVVFQDSAFGKSNLATCEQLAAEYKVKVVQTFPLAINAEDAKPVATGLAQAQPGAVVMIMAGRMTEVFIRDYRAGNVAAPLYTLSVGITDAAGSAKRLEGKLAGLVTASIVPPPQSLRVPIVAEYQRDRAELGEKVDSYTALEGYIVARVMVEGLRRAAGADARQLHRRPRASAARASATSRSTTARRTTTVRTSWTWRSIRVTVSCGVETLHLQVNGRVHALEKVSRETSLLHLLRNDLGLNGPKYGCGLGQCGACTVHVDGVAARACRDSGAGGGGARDHHARRPRRARRLAPGAGRRSSSAGGAVRPLPQRQLVMQAAALAGARARAERGAHPRRAVGQPVPLRDACRNPRCGAARGAHMFLPPRNPTQPSPKGEER